MMIEECFEDPVNNESSLRGSSICFGSPSRLPKPPLLQDVLMGLQHCSDESIDIVTAEKTSQHADVKFQWNGHALRTIQIKGEFNGWKNEHLLPDRTSGKCALIKKLCPGRYRYKYCIDGIDCLDDRASKVDNPTGPTNIILVINPLSNSAPIMERHLLGGNRFNKPTNSLLIADDSDSLPDLRGGSSKVLLGPPGPEGAHGFTHLEGYKHVNVRNINMSDVGAWAFVGCIKANSYMQSLDVSCNGLSDMGVKAIAACVAPMKSIQTIKLNANNFGVTGCRYLKLALCSCSSITGLELASNPIGDEGCTHLADILLHHVALKHLHLDCCLVTDKGVVTLAEAMVSNRTLQTLSLSQNKIQMFGADRLCFALTHNAALTKLNLNNNPLGAEGVRYVGEMLYSNDTLQELQLSCVNAVSGNSSMGLHALCYAFSKNRALRVLSLRGNDLNDERCDELAHALTKNRGLTALDLSNNHISNQWFQPNCHIRTKLLARMPTIRTSLDHNKAVLADPVLAEKYAVAPPVMDETFDGHWNSRRVWKKTDHAAIARHELRELTQAEAAGIAEEQAYVTQHMQSHCADMTSFLEEPANQLFLDKAAALVAQHYWDLGRLDDSPASEEQQKKLIAASDPHFTKMQVAVLSAAMIPLHQNDDEHHRRVVNPEQLERLCLGMCLPLQPQKVQEAVDATLIPGLCRTGFMRLTQYLKGTAAAHARKSRFERLRLLADLMLRPPVDEVRRLVVDSDRYTQQLKLVKQFRSLPDKQPAYVCSYCGMRFACAKVHKKHLEKGGRSTEHRLHKLNLTIYQAQRYLLALAKTQLTGSSFPCYFELVPFSKLPEDFSPQVLDNMGLVGRPIGVIEPDRTVRVEDMVGDYVKVTHDGYAGWIKFRVGKVHVLQPACSKVSGFSWSHLVVQQHSTYYIVRPTLPAKTQLKVRYMPALTAETCGYLYVGEVVECKAVLGDWLQIVYRKVASAWVLRVSGEGSSAGTEVTVVVVPQLTVKEAKHKKAVNLPPEQENLYEGAHYLLDALSPAVQQHLSHVMLKSPYVPTEDDLAVTELLTVDDNDFDFDEHDTNTVGDTIIHGDSIYDELLGR